MKAHRPRLLQRLWSWIGIHNLLARAAFLLPLLIPNLLTAPGADSIPDLGVIRRTNSIVWDDTNAYSTNVTLIGYGIYIGDTNQFTNNPPILAKLGEVYGGREWAGTNISLNGRFALAATVVANLVSTNVSGTNLTLVTNRAESGFSPMVAVTFLNGIPVPPNNFQLYSVMQVMAKGPLAAPSTGSELDLSGR
jgi:hypothetical protein